MSFSDGIIELTLPSGKIRATLNEESGWICEDEQTLQFLQVAFPYPDNPTLDFRPQNPNPMADLINQTVEALGATVIQPPEDDSPPGTVF